jgi:hypothetical protein
LNCAAPYRWPFVSPHPAIDPDQYAQAVTCRRDNVRSGATQPLQDLLTPIYDWFTEGLDTLDLKEAKNDAGGAGLT